MVRATFLTRSALGMALALGVAAGGLALPVAAKEKKPEAPKIAPSKPFIPVYVAAKDGVDKAANVAQADQLVGAVTALAQRVARRRGKTIAPLPHPQGVFGQTGVAFDIGDAVSAGGVRA